MADVSVEGQCQTLELQVDTGATVSVISLACARRYFKGAVVNPTTTKLFGVGRAPLGVVGTVSASVTVKNRQAVTDFYVVETVTTEALMGLDLLTKLGLTIRPATGELLAVKSEKEVVPLPVIRGYQHKIVLRKDAEPTRHGLRRLPFSVRDEVSKELQKLQMEDVIEPIDASEWISPVVVSRKKDGKIRLCVDLRGPNSQIVAEVHPLPTISELQAEFRGTVFSRIDLRLAYHQLELDPESRSITAFITHDGLFQYKRVPFGLASSGAAFQKLLDKLLVGLPGVGHYLDDIVCAGRDRKEHDERLTLLMQRLRDANVTINMDKSEFSQPAIDFCGYRLSSTGVTPLQSHVQAILEAPAPLDVKELRSFLGLCGWFFHFIPRYAMVVAPMTRLLKKEACFDWTPEVEHSFRSVKHEIANSTVLQPFHPNLQTYVTVDASEKGDWGHFFSTRCF